MVNRLPRWIFSRAGLLLVSLAAVSAAQRPVTIKNITISTDGRTVALEADGPLPEPATGKLQNPPRIYLDLAGVKPGPVKQVAGGPNAISGVRVALNSADPLLTRVVIDLTAMAVYHVDSATRSNGRITISLNIATAPGAASGPVQPGALPPAAQPAVPQSSAGQRSPAIQPPTQATSSPAPPMPAPSAAATSKPPALAPAVVAARDKYLQQIAPSVARLQELRPVLTSIEKLDPSVVADDLQVAARSFEAIGRELGAVKPPTVVMVQHDMLQRACGLAASAARLRADSLSSKDPSLTANASSAAAGAIMLVERAREEMK